MNIENVNVTAERVTSWERAKKMALKTAGKKMVNLPDDEWKRKMIICEHSPLRMVEYDITIENIPQWVTVHFVRHHIGIEKFVATQRTDRNPNIKCERDELPQGELNTMTIAINAQALINISRVRLCHQASPETRAVWTKIKEAIRAIDPMVAQAMQPNCIYRGRCPEPKCCGWNKSVMHSEAWWEYESLFNPKISNEPERSSSNLTYKGKMYECRVVNYQEDENSPFEEVLVGPDSLESEMFDEQGEYIDREAEITDNKIFFYIPDKMIESATDEEIQDYLQTNI